MTAWFRPGPRSRSVLVIGRFAGVVSIVVLSVLWALSACGGGAASEERVSPAPGASSGTQVTGELTVMAAASLDPAFTRIADAFEEANPGTTVRLSFGASSSLAQQILDGAPAGVFASADQASMERVARERSGRELSDLRPVVFAANHMSIAVPAGNPAGVSGVQDFSRADLRLGICAPQVPCGRYAAEVFRSAGVEPRADTEEPDVTSLLAKVASGDLDAGLVYATDVTNGGGGGGRRGVDAVPVPGSEQVRATYPIASLIPEAETGRPEADLAAAFVEFVLGPGQEFLTAAGFGPP